MVKFPPVSGENLAYQAFRLPDDLEGELNIVFVPFQMWHQFLVNTWVPAAQQIEALYPGVRYYELPTIERLDPNSQRRVNEGMRAGIPDPGTRQRTITLYLDKRGFREALGLGSEWRMYVLLLDRQGNVVWRSEGQATRAKARALALAIETELQKQPATA